MQALRRARETARGSMDPSRSSMDAHPRAIRQLCHSICALRRAMDALRRAISAPPRAMDGLRQAMNTLYREICAPPRAMDGLRQAMNALSREICAPPRAMDGLRQAMNAPRCSHRRSRWPPEPARLGTGCSASGSRRSPEITGRSSGETRPFARDTRVSLPVHGPSLRETGRSAWERR